MPSECGLDPSAALICQGEAVHFEQQPGIRANVNGANDGCRRQLSLIDDICHALNGSIMRHVSQQHVLMYNA